MKNQRGYVWGGGRGEGEGWLGSGEGWFLKGCLRKLAYIRFFFSSSEMTLNICWKRSSHKRRGSVPLEDRSPLQNWSIQMLLLPAERDQAKWLEHRNTHTASVLPPE